MLANGLHLPHSLGEVVSEHLGRSSSTRVFRLDTKFDDFGSGQIWLREDQCESSSTSLIEPLTINSVPLGPDSTKSSTVKAISRRQSTSAQDPGLTLAKQGVIKEGMRFSWLHEHAQAHKVSITALARRRIPGVGIVRFGRRREELVELVGL